MKAPIRRVPARSALRAARELELPVTSDFRTNFQAYSGHYRLGWLRGAIMAYLRGFHNGTGCTMVPTESLRTELQAAGFERLVVVARGVDTEHFDPARRSESLRRQRGLAADEIVVLYVRRLAAEKNLDLLLGLCGNTAGHAASASATSRRKPWPAVCRYWPSITPPPGSWSNMGKTAGSRPTAMALRSCNWHARCQEMRKPCASLGRRRGAAPWRWVGMASCARSRRFLSLR